MNRPLTLLGETDPPVTLRAIAAGDIETLRLWKNANKAAFFFKEEISPEAQKLWFESYLKRPADFMFMIESEEAAAGCMGFRVENRAADCYNIIGAPEGRGKGVLRQAMILMCSYILAEHSKDVSCKVLKDNPAVGWYEKCGYRKAGSEKDYYKLALDLSSFKPCAYKKTP